MKTAEKNLLLAVRNRLRTAIGSGGAGYTDAQCQIEAFTDEGCPAMTADTYIVVGPLGFRPGPRHNTSGGVRDLIYSVGIFVVKRSTATPTDRERNLFALNSGSLSDEVDKCFQVIDWKYEVTAAANVLILAEASSSEGFIHPLVFVGADPKPKHLGPEFFQAKAGSQPVGMGRLFRFDHARRITTI